MTMAEDQEEDGSSLHQGQEADERQDKDVEENQLKEMTEDGQPKEDEKGKEKADEENIEEEGVAVEGGEGNQEKEGEIECKEESSCDTDDNPSSMTSSKESNDNIQSKNEPVVLETESDMRSHTVGKVSAEDEGADKKTEVENSQIYQTVLSQISHNTQLVDDAIRNLQAENLSFRNENTLLKERVKTLERKMELITQDLISTKRNTFSNDQYLRQHNLEIEGIATVDDDKNLEETVTDILKAIDVDVAPDNFEACHRLMTSRGGKHDFPGTTICRFTNQRICENIHRNKIKLEELKETGFYANISINENVNLYFKDLISKCEILKKREMIEDTWSFKGIPIIKLFNGDVKHITHPYDLERLFTGFNYSLDDSK